MGKTMRAEFVEEAVITPLTVLCKDIVYWNMEMSAEDLTELFDTDLVEVDVLPVLEMDM